jgi:L-seryl-tRNA(Ser) seleniumtransferase
MVAAPVAELERRGAAIVRAAGLGSVVASDAIPGAGSAPGATIASVAVSVPGDLLARLRASDPPIVARARDRSTLLDLRTVDPADDAHLARALRACAS